MLLGGGTVSFLLLFLTTSWAALPDRVIEMKNALSHDLQSLHDIIPGRHHRIDEHQRNVEIHSLLDEFLAQNQQTISAILRVLKLIDHDLENVIHDCVRVFDLDSLQSTNPIFGQITKPLLLQVRDLCELIADSRIDEVEASLERVEREATVYRESMDQALKDIAVIFGQLEEDLYDTWAERKKVQIVAQLESINQTLTKDLDENFNKYFPKWIENYKKFVELLPENFNYDPEEHPEIASLYDLLDYVDNETTVLQEELEELLNDWIDIVLETVDVLTNGTEEIIDYFLDYPLEKLTNGEASLGCAASFYGDLDHSMVGLLQQYYNCIDFEKDMLMAFNRIAPVVDSTNKAITFLLESYIGCAKMFDQLEDSPSLSECFIDLQEIINKTREFVEHKASEVYFHVEDAMVFNGVIVEACWYKEYLVTVPLIEDKINKIENCKSNDFN